MHQVRSIIAALTAASFAVACSQEQAPVTVAEPLTPAPGAATGPLGGELKLDGSSTVLPVSQALAKAFTSTNPNVKIAAFGAGTGTGLAKLCSGEIDIAGASRPINRAEGERCKAQQIDYIELPIAFDSLSVVASKRNTFLECLTLSELKTLWEPAAEGKVTLWNQVRPSFPAEPIALFGPGKESGTYDYFTLATVGTEGQSRGDYSASADDREIEKGVAESKSALGFFGYSYYLANKEQLKTVAVDGGKGCVQPSPESVRDQSYQPLSRPLFIYVNRARASRPEVRAFARSFFAPQNVASIETIGYMPLPASARQAELARLDSGVTGSALGGHGSVLGVRPDRFNMDKDRLQSALVQ